MLLPFSWTFLCIYGMFFASYLVSGWRTFCTEKLLVWNAAGCKAKEDNPWGAASPCMGTSEQKRDKQINQVSKSPSPQRRAQTSRCATLRSHKTSWPWCLTWEARIADQLKYWETRPWPDTFTSCNRRCSEYYSVPTSERKVLGRLRGKKKTMWLVLWLENREPPIGKSAIKQEGTYEARQARASQL